VTDENARPDPAAEGTEVPDAAAAASPEQPDDASAAATAADAAARDGTPRARDASAGDESVRDEGASDDAALADAASGEARDDELDVAADQLEVDLELLLSEREQYLEAFRRAQADFENFRKQVYKRQEEAVDGALGRFVDNLLPVLDACDAALAHGAEEVEPILTALYNALAREGLERIDPKGAPFDPTEAEAVAHEPGDGGEHVVSEVLRPGYRWRGRVLRPAMVKVTD